ncbi:LysR substrate-binding domain-containing protein [Paraburkholderia terrae]
MSLLLAFESSARHASFTRAAEELALTQSAVSRQVQTLESMLGVALFHREGKRIAVTDVGGAYMNDIANALALIRSATLQALTASSPTTQLRVATLPTLGTKWLLPRLHRFYRAHPDLQIDLRSQTAAAEFTAMDVDAAVIVDAVAPANVISHRLYAEELVLVGNPETWASTTLTFDGQSLPPSTSRLPEKNSAKQPTRRNTPKSASGVSPVSIRQGRDRRAAEMPAVLRQLTLLRVRSFAEAWREWCDYFGTPYDTVRIGPSFELTSQLIQAVIAGIGIALVPRVLVDDELADGRLLTPFESIASSRAYYLVYPERVQSHPALIAFRDWLLAEWAATSHTPAR